RDRCRKEIDLDFANPQIVRRISIFHRVGLREGPDAKSLGARSESTPRILFPLIPPQQFDLPANSHPIFRLAPRARALQPPCPRPTRVLPTNQGAVVSEWE